MLDLRSPRVSLLASAFVLALPLNPTAPRTAPPGVTAQASFAEPGLSPDGREIAFVSAGDIWTVPAIGGPARLLVSHEADESRPLYSPDGTRLAFVSTRTGNGDVYVLTLATGTLERITFDDMPEQLDAWSRDGKWLYFSSTRDDISGMADEYRVHADGGTPMPVAADRYASEYWGAPSPDGATLAITARGVSRTQWWRNGRSHLDESEIDLVRDNGDTPTYTTLVGMGARSGWPMWSPDGATIYFVSDRSTSGTGTPNLWSQPVAGGEPQQLTHFTSGRVLWPSIAADGRSIVFERDFGIWRYDVATRQAAPVSITLEGSPATPAPEHVTLTRGIEQFSLSPDGKKVAFIVHGEIFAASAKDGGAAMRVTDTPADEDQVVWAPDSRRIVYTSDRDGPWHLYMYDFGRNTETRLTNASANDASPHWSPDGKTIVYKRGARELRAIDPATRADRALASAELDQQPFAGAPHDLAFSPDGRWVAFLPRSGTHGFQNATVIPLAGGEARPVSFLANSFANMVAWSHDGTYLLFESAQRTEPRQLARIDLIPRTPRFREDQFRDLFREQQPPSTRPTQPATRTPATSDSAPTNATPPASLDSLTSRRSATRAPAPHVDITFDDIRERLSLLPIDIDVYDVAISPDGKNALLTGEAAGHVNLYEYPLDDLAQDRAPKQLTSTTGRKSDAQWSADGKEVFYLEDGRINVVTVDSHAIKPLAVTADMDVDFAHEKTEVFDEAWSYLRDNFFNPTMNGVDWNAVRAEYASRIAGAQSPAEMRRILSLMVGELNSSHSGIGGPAAQKPYSGRIGLRFDRAEYERNGRFRITDVVPLSPAAIAGIHAGEYLVRIDSAPLSAHTNVDELLANRIGRRTVLGVAPSASGAVRDIAVLPVNATTEKGLVYRAWVEQERAYVAKASGGKLGYVHMFDMSADALKQLYIDLDAENMSREGVVIDVRNNNGGFVNAYALDVLARQPYLVMQGRGRSAVPARTQLGQRALERPTALVVNQHTLSDGEDFTEGYEALHLGPVIGEPTAGWIIFTSNFTLLDSTTVRIPFARITDTQGRQMEMHPRPVDVQVQRPIGSSYRNVDPQLDAAVRVLLERVNTQRTAATR